MQHSVPDQFFNLSQIQVTYRKAGISLFMV